MQKHGHAYAHHFSPDKMHDLDSPERRKMMPPEELLDMVPVQPNDVVVDLGTGMGYFSIPAAKIMNTTIYAVDAEPKMLEIVKRKITEQGMSNITPVVGRIEEIPLQEEVADVVIASLVLHGIKPMSNGLREMYRILKPGGKLLCIDFERKESPIGPPMKFRIPAQEMEGALTGAGFTVAKKQSPVDFIYVFVATK
jgi:ubiquinone/menaquinone biosynthesis C-methylase UbiE